MRRTLLLTLLLVCLGGCTAIRNDRTEFEEAPEPTGTAAVSIGRRHSVVIEQVGGTWNGTPYRADLETRQRFAETLRKSLTLLGELSALGLQRFELRGQVRLPLLHARPLSTKLLVIPFDRQLGFVELGLIVVECLGGLLGRGDLIARCGDRGLCVLELQ